MSSSTYAQVITRALRACWHNNLPLWDTRSYLTANAVVSQVNPDVNDLESGSFKTETPGNSTTADFPGYQQQFEKSVRLGFIRKVYGILSIQLALT
jgi:hypothetical protein